MTARRFYFTLGLAGVLFGVAGGLLSVVLI
jgi:hypothetical protein